MSVFNIPGILSWPAFRVFCIRQQSALNFADKLAHAPGIVKRGVTFFAAPISDHLAQLASHLPQGCHTVLSLVAESSEPAMLLLVESHSGTVSYRKTAAEGQKSNRTLM